MQTRKNDTPLSQHLFPLYFSLGSLAHYLNAYWPIASDCVVGEGLSALTPSVTELPFKSCFFVDWVPIPKIILKMNSPSQETPKEL